MPPKDAQPPVLFFSADDGKTFKPIGKIAEIPEFVFEPGGAPDMYEPYIEGEDGCEKVWRFGKEEMTFTATTVIINKNPIRLLFGRREDIPNAWLHLHGYPTRRKRKGTRKEKNCGRRKRNGTRKKKNYGQ